MLVRQTMDDGDFITTRGMTMAKDVLCEVRNCHYWAEGNRCSAESIYVVSHAGNMASDSTETDCKTFVPAHEA